MSSEDLVDLEGVIALEDGLDEAMSCEVSDVGEVSLSVRPQGVRAYLVGEESGVHFKKTSDSLRLGHRESEKKTLESLRLGHGD